MSSQSAKNVFEHLGLTFFLFDDMGADEGQNAGGMKRRVELPAAQPFSQPGHFRHPDHKEFIQVSAYNRGKTKALKRGDQRIARFSQNAVVEAQPGELAVKKARFRRRNFLRKAFAFGQFLQIVRKGPPLGRQWFLFHEGRVTMMLVPSSKTLSAFTPPPWASTMCLAMARPRPVPPSSLERALSTL